VTTRQFYGTDELDMELSVWAGAQLTVLSLLWVSVGLHSAGWVAGMAYSAVAGGLITVALHRSWTGALGPANRVTLARAMLVGGVTAMVADAMTNRPPLPLLVVLASVALALDAVDGYVARRTGSTSKLGARFDMEVDAFLIMVLSVFDSRTLGWWVLAIGAMRYAFVAAGWALRWLRASLPESYARKTVAAIQGIALVAGGSRLFPHAVSMLIVGFALATLVWSFGRDVVWLWRARTERPVAEREDERVASV
jgi:phosphatidylglycerophosphate synthase